MESEVESLEMGGRGSPILAADHKVTLREFWTKLILRSCRH